MLLGFEMKRNTLDTINFHHMSTCESHSYIFPIWKPSIYLHSKTEVTNETVINYTSREFPYSYLAMVGRRCHIWKRIYIPRTVVKIVAKKRGLHWYWYWENTPGTGRSCGHNDIRRKHPARIAAQSILYQGGWPSRSRKASMGKWNLQYVKTDIPDA